MRRKGMVYRETPTEKQPTKSKWEPRLFPSLVPPFRRCLDPDACEMGRV